MASTAKDASCCFAAGCTALGLGVDSSLVLLFFPAPQKLKKSC